MWLRKSRRECVYACGVCVCKHVVCVCVCVCVVCVCVYVCASVSMCGTSSW